MIRKKVDYLLIGTGAAPLLAAQRILNRGGSVLILNPDRDFFLENSELSLDLMDFQTSNHDLNQRFANNLPEKVYQDLIPEFPGALELWKEEEARQSGQSYQVEGAPWIRVRRRLWLTRESGNRLDRAENLYLRALDGGWKPQWMEGLSLARRMPGAMVKNFESRVPDRWVGFLGPKLGEIDVERYRLGLLEFVQERLGADQVLTGAHLLSLDSKGVRFQLASGLPQSVEIARKVLFFWTPKMERMITDWVEQNEPRSLRDLQASVTKQRWEEWDILSREAVPASIVAHYERLRIWSVGEGPPPVGGWNVIRVMRRADLSEQTLGPESLGELADLFQKFLGWQTFSVRKMRRRILYRWNETAALRVRGSDLDTEIIRACDGPLNWIATQVRHAVDGVS